MLTFHNKLKNLFINQNFVKIKIRTQMLKKFMNTFKDEKCWRFLGSISVDHLHKIGLKLKSQTFWFEIISPTVYLFFIGKKNPRWLFWNKKNLKENKLHGHNNYGLRFFSETSHWRKCYKYSIHLNQKSSYFVLEL